MSVDNAPEQPCLGSGVAHGGESEPDQVGRQARRVVIIMVFVPALRAQETTDLFTGKVEQGRTE